MDNDFCKDCNIFRFSDCRKDYNECIGVSDKGYCKYCWWITKERETGEMVPRCDECGLLKEACSHFVVGLCDNHESKVMVSFDN